MRWCLLALSLCTLFLAGPSLWAQTEAEITGRIMDSSGAAIPAASVTVTNVGTRAVRIVASDNSGVYDVPDLVPGSYSVSVNAKGFRRELRTGIVLQVTQVARLDFKMQVGEVTQVIQVTANATQLDTENTTVGSVVGNQRIEDLPLNGRNFLQLTALEANVSYGFGTDGTAVERLGGTRSEESISVAGGRAEMNYFTLDGVSNTDVSYNTYTFLPSIDAIQEFKIQTGVYPAEFGRGLGQIDVSTKPGTNAFHGALYEFLRNSSTDAENYCFTVHCPATALIHQNQFGVTVGGPVWIPKIFNGKNKLFFMVNYEGFRYDQGLSEVGTVATLAERAGDFTGLNPIYDPATRVLQPNGTVAASLFPGNMIPAARFNPDAVKLLNFFPTPNVPGAGLINNYADVLNDTESDNQLTVRIDYNQSTKSTWFGRYSFSNELSVTPASAILQMTNRLNSKPKQFVLSNVRTFSPTVVNEFWFGYNRLNNQILNWDSGTSVNEVGAIGGIPGSAVPYPLIYGVPTIAISGLTCFGDNDGIPFVMYHNTFQYRDVLSLMHGTHSFNLGAEIRRDQDTTAGNSFIRGDFTFNGVVTENPASALGTGVPFADYMLGEPELYCSAQALAQTELRSTDQGYFLDDTWKVTPKLTLSYGLRYDYFAPWTEKHDNITNILFPAPDTTNQPILVRPGTGNFYTDLPAKFTFGGGIQTIRSNVMGPATYYTSKDNFAPRFGIAYSPTSKWVVRTGFGMFYVPDMQDINFDPGRTLAARRQVPTDACFPDITIEQPFVGGSTFDVLSPFSYAADEYMHTPYFYQYLFDVQRQLSPNLLVDVGYQGSAGHKIPGLLDLNDPFILGPGSVTSRRPWPQFGVIQTNSDWVNSNYNALSVRLEKRLSHGINFVESYTWGRSIDDSSAVRDHGGDTLFPQDPYDPNADRGLSNYQVENRSASALLWQLPIGRGYKWLSNSGGVTDAFLGGWMLGAIVTLETGSPYDMNSGSDPANIGESGYQRPNYTGISPSVPSQGPSAWFNTAAFVTPPLYTYGDVGRNTLIGPGLADLDLSMVKDFVIHEGTYLQFRFETFNTLNHPNWGAPNTTLTSPSFGTITSTSLAMRELQFALKFVF